MEKGIKKFLEIIVYAVCGIVGSVLVGLIAYGPKIFLFGDRGFQFITLGVIGALIFALLKYHRWWSAALIVLLAAVVQFIRFSVMQFDFNVTFIFVRWTIVSGFLIFGIACLFRTRIKKIPIGKFLLLGCALALLYVVNTLVRSMPIRTPIPANVLVYNALLGFFVGSGLGLGIEIGELASRLFTKGETPPR